MTTTFDGATGLRLIRVDLCEGTIQETGVVAREIVRVDLGSVYELTVEGRLIGYLKLILTPEDDVKAFAQKTRESGRVFLGRNLDFSDAVDSALGVL